MMVFTPKKKCFKINKTQKRNSQVKVRLLAECRIKEHDPPRLFTTP